MEEVGHILGHIRGGGGSLGYIRGGGGSHTRSHTWRRWVTY